VRDDTTSGHEEAEGLKVVPETTESVRAGPGCPAGAPVRNYDVVAIDVDITVNRFLDHDPQGRMYALASDVERVRAEEAQNAAARKGDGLPAVTAGLQGDAIQPLVLRVHQGECLRIRLTNQLRDEPASLHVHGSALRLAGTRVPATAAEPRATAAPGGTVTYEWMVPTDEPEATHVMHSHGNDRVESGHGLFGAVIVEQAGTRWLDPRTGQESATGWDSIVSNPGHGDFREFVLTYHEIGDEQYQLLDRTGNFVPLVDPMTSSYRPDARAINYRSEPFGNRLTVQQERGQTPDESVEYSSYAFGDPTTPIARSYLGDPVKQRVLHGGSEVFHVHHVHGGSIRWSRQPGAEDPATSFGLGLEKKPLLVEKASARTDSQSLGPSESFDVLDECGSGGCQQSAGDFLFHCHVAQHYFSGMWGIWRVYNTLQDGTASTDGLPALRPLNDRAGGVAAGVPSSELRPELQASIEQQLPPPGVPRGYDAAVWDWTRGDGAGDVLGEPETAEQWPGYSSTAPGSRPKVLFDPRTGRLAYPFLRPHLGQRPPFAPNHGPAPFLDPVHSGPDPPAPGENGPASVCPAGTKPKAFAVNAIEQPVTINAKQKIVDPGGQLFVLRSQVDGARTDRALQAPLAIRANAGEDCVDILLRSELSDNRDLAFSKVSLHVHFVQFDVQASDGVDTGFNYEQSVRPFRAEGVRLVDAVEAGATEIVVADASRFQAGTLLGIGLDQDQSFEAATVAAVDGSRIAFDRPLRFGHQPDEVVGTEFVRYRWYPDAQFGTSYFHDHVNALKSWGHGLFGALVAEPPGSTYTDPHTGLPLLSGPVADIHTDAKVSADVTGSFRELLLFMQDDQPLTRVDRSSGGAVNLRAEPLDGRGGDHSMLFSTPAHGDPETPIIEADVGDPIVLRSLVGAANDIHTVHLDGHWFRAEPFSPTSPPISTVHLGISERFDLVVPAAGGQQRRAGDYLYYSGRSFKLREGSWGLVRVGAGGLVPLAGRTPVAPATGPICPPEAPLKPYAVSAVDAALPMLAGNKGKIYVLGSDEAEVVAGRKPAEPLVLHVNAGDCVRVTLANHTQAGPVSFTCDILAYDPLDSGGVAAGNDPPQAVAAGATRTYTFYADPALGQPAAMVRDWGDVLTNPGLGLYGAVVVGPVGATYREPTTGADLGGAASWRADVVPPAGEGPPYRDFTLFLQDEDEAIGTHRMPYTVKVRGTVGLNYRTFPDTPVLDAFAGDPTRIDVLAPWSEQAQVFSVEGHRWPQEPGLKGSNLLSSLQVGGMEAVSLELQGGAGGNESLPGVYRYGDHRDPYREAGLVGTFRVRAPGDQSAGPLRPLPGHVAGPTGRGPTGTLVPGAVFGLVALAIGTVVVVGRRRSRMSPTPSP
jgi:hypothetical protein